MFKPSRHMLLLILAVLCLAPSDVAYHRVKYVYDGDTVQLENGQRLRYLGINTPEVSHDRGKAEFLAVAAYNFNRELLKNARISLEYDRKKIDRYGRQLAYVFLENGKMVNDLLVQKGLAHVMFNVDDMLYRDLLLASQRGAINKRLGIWTKLLETDKEQYLGNSNSFRFHRTTCRFSKKIRKTNTVKFKSRRDAYWEGYSPCKQCNP
jgi:micrococcal nuclease